MKTRSTTELLPYKQFVDTRHPAHLPSRQRGSSTTIRNRKRDLPTVRSGRRRNTKQSTDTCLKVSQPSPHRAAGRRGPRDPGMDRPVPMSRLSSSEYGGQRLRLGTSRYRSIESSRLDANGECSLESSCSPRESNILERKRSKNYLRIYQHLQL